MEITSPKEITAILKELGISPLKKYGQNFLCDKNIVEKIADSMRLEASDCVLEVGPGLGALTCALSRRAGRVMAVEIDAGMITALSRTLSGAQNVEIIHGDILKTDIAAVTGTESFHACGNLPYYITAKCILKLIESGAKSLTIMVQKEVAERLCASPGSREYGALTASVNYYCKPEILFTVGRNCFYPAPDVDSAIVHMELNGAHLPVDREKYVKIMRGCFAMRRKTLKNNLTAALKGEAGAQAARLALSAIEKAGIPPSARAEELSAEDFMRLTTSIYG